jgi:ketosteroid isomerase-like protein
MADQRALESRIRRLEDRVQIQDLAMKYAIAFDDRDMERLRTFFTSDACLRTQDGTLNLTGRDTIIAQLSLRIAANGPTNHVNHSHIIDLSRADANSATGLVTAHAEMWSGGKALLAALRYSDVYRREDSEWRFASRIASYLYFLPTEDYTKMLGAQARILVRPTPAAADYPESLPTWQAFYGKISTESA